MQAHFLLSVLALEDRTNISRLVFDVLRRHHAAGARIRIPDNIEPVRAGRAVERAFRRVTHRESRRTRFERRRYAWTGGRYVRIGARDELELLANLGIVM